MRQEIKDLMKAINGNFVVWSDDFWKGLTLDAIILAPPDGEVVSIKPYGYTPEELYEGHRAVKEIFDLSYFKRTEFCLNSINADHSNKNNVIKILKAISNVSEGGELNLDTLLKSVGIKVTGGNASCPY